MPTDVGVYVEWSLLLQKELQRCVTLHQQLEQMRALEAGMSILVGEVDDLGHAALHHNAMQVPW